MWANFIYQNCFPWFCDSADWALQTADEVQQVIQTQPEKINFTCSSQDRDLPPKAVRNKKESPRQKNRDSQRKETVLKKKLEESNHSTKLPHETGPESSVQSEESYPCDQCDHKASCKVSLRKHIGHIMWYLWYMRKVLQMIQKVKIKKFRLNPSYMMKNLSVLISNMVIVIKNGSTPSLSRKSTDWS